MIRSKLFPMDNKVDRGKTLTSKDLTIKMREVDREKQKLKSITYQKKLLNRVEIHGE